MSLKSLQKGRTVEFLHSRNLSRDTDARMLKVKLRRERYDQPHLSGHGQAERYRQKLQTIFQRFYRSNTEK